MPRAILANIFLVSQILLLFHSAKGSLFHSQNMGNSENISILHSAPCDNNYIIARGAFNSSYIQYQSKGDKGKNLSIKEYLNMARPYLSDIINDHKTRGLVRYHSGNKTWVEETPSE